MSTSRAHLRENPSTHQDTSDEIVGFGGASGRAQSRPERDEPPISMPLRLSPACHDSPAMIADRGRSTLLGNGFLGQAGRRAADGADRHPIAPRPNHPRPT